MSRSTPPTTYRSVAWPPPWLDHLSEPILTFDAQGALTGANRAAAPLVAALSPGGHATLPPTGYPTVLWRAWQATPPPPTTAVPWTWSAPHAAGAHGAMVGICSPLYADDGVLAGLIWVGEPPTPAPDSAPGVTPLPEVLARLDRAGRHLSINPAVTAVTGRPADAFLGHTLAELGLPAEQVTAWDAQRTAVLAGGPTSTGDYTISTAQGLHTFACRLVLEPGPHATVVAVLGSARASTDPARVTPALPPHMDQQAAANDLGRLALCGLPLDTLFQRATALLATLLAVPYTCLMENRPASQTLQLRAGVGWPLGNPAPAAIKVDWDDPIGRTLRQEDTLQFTDLAADPRFTDLHQLTAQGVVSGLITLIRTPAQIFGTLAAFTTARRVFRADEIGFVEMLAQILAAAVARSAAEERFSKAFHTNPQPMSLIRLGDGLIIDVNERWLACFGGTRATVIGQAKTVAIAWLDPHGWPILQARIRAEGAVSEVESGYRPPQGGVGYRQLSAQRLDLADEPHALLMSRDVTAYRQAVTALHASEARFATAFHSSPDGYAITRLADDTFVDVNAAWSRMLGYSRAEVVNRSSADLTLWVDPADRDLAGPPDPGEAPRPVVEVQLRGKDRTLRFYEVTTAVLDIAATACVLTILRDVTEAHGAAAALRASEERFAQAFRVSPHGVCILQLHDRRLLDVNTAWTRINGYTRDEALGHTLTELALELDPATSARMRTAFQTGGRVDQMEVERRHRDGTLRRYRISAEGMELAGERCALITTQDVTAEWAAAVQLQRQYDFLAAVTGNLAEGVYALDCAGRINFVNAATEELLGWSAADLLGQPMHARLHARRADGTPLGAAECAVLAILHTQQPVCIEDDVFTRQDGRLLPVAYAAAPIVSAGTLVGVVVAFRDTSVQKHALATRRLLTARLNTLLSISRAILAAQTPTAIVEAAFTRLPQILPYYGARVSLLHRTGQAPEILIATGTAATWPPPTLTAAAPDAPGLPEGGWIQVPLIVEGHTVGLLELATAAPSDFQRSQVRIAQEVADQLAVALQHAQLFAQVTTTRRQLQQLAGRLVETQETERHHLARELHDELGQALTALKLGYQATRHQTDPAAQAAAVTENVALIDEVIAGVRRLAQDLRPPLLDELGLVAALDSYLTRQAERAGLVPQFHSTLDPAVLTPGVATTCFRVAQEAVTNVIRHAQATTIGITLTAAADTLEVTVWDNGQGFDVVPARARAVQGCSLGLLSMEERVVLLGGTLQITAGRTIGTTVRARLPILPAQPSEAAR